MVNKGFLTTSEAAKLLGISRISVFMRIKKGYIKAYSTNKETYPDGRQIHEPLDIPLDEARFLLVLGYVVKKNGGTMMFSNRNK